MLELILLQESATCQRVGTTLLSERVMAHVMHCMIPDAVRHPSRITFLATIILDVNQEREAVICGKAALPQLADGNHMSLPVAHWPSILHCACSRSNSRSGGSNEETSTRFHDITLAKEPGGWQDQSRACIQRPILQ